MSAVKDIILVATKTLGEITTMISKYLDTRQEAYNRQQDRRKRKAIEYAERYILYVQEHMEEDKKLIKLRKKFFKYNN